MLQFTNHPLVDVGVAVILNHFDTESPDEITHEQLQTFAEYLESAYSTPYFRSYLFVLFPNSPFINVNMKEENRRRELDRILLGFLEERAPLFTCVFCGQEAHFRAYRQHIPLITGEGMINFFPSNRIGVEVCPYCLLSIQAFPLGSLKVRGQAFLVHSDDQLLLLDLVAKFMERNETNLLLNDSKSGIDGKFPKTLFMHELLEVDRFHKREMQSGSITVYHLTNYGTKADIAMYPLPSQILSFIHSLRGAIYSQTWNVMVQDGWAMGNNQKKKGDEDQINPYLQSNIFYEDLFDLYNSYRSFIKRHLFEGMARRINELKRNDKVKEGLKYWAITEFILEEVALLRKERIERTRALADRLADYMIHTNDKKLFNDLFYNSGKNQLNEYGEFRNYLLKFCNNFYKQHGKDAYFSEFPITFDDFIEVFEDWEDTYSSWRLGRDLVLLRLMERLYYAGKLNKSLETNNETE